MGAGNVCVFGQAEGLYYVDRDFLDVYSRKTEDNEYESCLLGELECGDDTFEYDEFESELRRDDMQYNLCEMLRKRFPSFEYVNKWVSNTRKALLENELFYIVLEDNQWSIAVELIQKEGEYGGEEKVGLQMGLYLKYLKGIKEILLDMYGEIGTYNGAWTSGRLRKEDYYGNQS